MLLLALRANACGHAALACSLVEHVLEQVELPLLLAVHGEHLGAFCGGGGVVERVTGRGRREVRGRGWRFEEWRDARLMVRACLGQDLKREVLMCEQTESLDAGGRDGYADMRNDVRVSSVCLRRDKQLPAATQWMTAMRGKWLRSHAGCEVRDADSA